MRLVVREFLFDPKKGVDVAFSVFLGVLAIISVLLMMAESVDHISRDYNTYFRVAESIVTGIFTIEWCLGGGFFFYLKIPLTDLLSREPSLQSSIQPMVTFITYARGAPSLTDCQFRRFISKLLLWFCSRHAGDRILHCLYRPKWISRYSMRHSATYA